MPRAVLKNGVVCLLEPIPPDWAEGQELWVEEAPNGAAQSLDQWHEELEALCAANDPEEDARLQTALDEAHRQAKTLMRREMGLP